MTVEWNQARLDDLTDNDSPITYGVVKPGDPGDVLFIRGGDIAGGRVLRNQLRTITREVSEQYRRTLLRGGELLICLVGQPGQVAVAPAELAGANIARQVGLIRLCSAVDAEFISYFLQSPDGQASLGTYTGGSVQQVINLGDLRTVNVPIPPLYEQKRIVGILDEAFDGIAIAKANAEKNLQNARALFESHLESVFTQRGKGWVEKRIGEISKHSLGKMLDKAKNRGELQPYLRNLNVRWFTFDLSDLLQMRFHPEEAAKYTAIKGDVLICEGGYPGRAAIWDEDYPVYFQKALHRVRFHEPEHNKWFVYYLYAQDKNGALRSHFSGTGIQHFTGEVLSRFELPLPPLPELRFYVAKIEELSTETQRLESIHQQKLVALESLKKSLLHEAFTGAL
jgi:type I restriction enzyme S subunit